MKVTVVMKTGKMRVVSSRDAKLLVALGKAEIYPPAKYETRAITPTEPKEPDDKPKRKYQRRDMQAKD